MAPPPRSRHGPSCGRLACSTSSFARTVACGYRRGDRPRRRVIVGPDLTIPGHPEIFVVGDAAVQPWKAGRPTPGVAQGAIQGGKYAAAVIRRRILQRPVQPFRYSDRGDVAVIGRLSGVTNIGWLGPFGRQSGFLAWALWLGIHILYLIGFSNRLVVLIRWAWSFLTHGRGTRLITGTTLLPPIVEPEPPVLAPIEPGDVPGASAPDFSSRDSTASAPAREIGSFRDVASGQFENKLNHPGRQGTDAAVHP